MGKYLKMSDYFVTGTFSADYGDIHSVIKYKPSAEGLTCRAAHYAVEHAINSHDGLVAEVERLRLMISECYPYIKDKADWGNEYEVDLADRLLEAAM